MTNHTTTDQQFARMLSDLDADKRQGLTEGTLSYGRCGGNASGAVTRYRVTSNVPGASYFMGYVFAMGRGWAAEGAWSGRPIVCQGADSRHAAGELLRAAAIRTHDATVAGRA